MHTVPVIQSLPDTHRLSRPLAAVAAALRTWREHRRRRADLALLMGLDRHTLADIGVTPPSQDQPAFLMEWHPAMVASSLRHRAR